MIEPILSADDIRVWDTWQRAAKVHGATRAHARRIDSSLRLLDVAMSHTPNSAVSWSGGKDSTVMTHLVCVKFGAKVAVFSEKDDLDFPGEEAYVRRLGSEWHLDIRVVHPDVSPAAWVAERAALMSPGDDIHGRSSGLSKTCFYPVMQACNKGFDAVMLGLRTEESGIRRHLRASRGRYYRLVDGTHRVLPVADWTGLDVYAYAQINGIELLPLYRCLAFMHADAPWTLRKSWWLPGCGAGFGQVTWLRRYYPSLYRQLCQWMPTARGLA